jgi:hypothetical protein
MGDSNHGSTVSKSHCPGPEGRSSSDSTGSTFGQMQIAGPPFSRCRHVWTGQCSAARRMNRKGRLKELPTESRQNEAEGPLACGPPPQADEWSPHFAEPTLAVRVGLSRQQKRPTKLCQTTADLKDNGRKILCSLAQKRGQDWRAVSGSITASVLLKRFAFSLAWFP